MYRLAPGIDTAIFRAPEQLHFYKKSKEMGGKKMNAIKSCREIAAEMGCSIFCIRKMLYTHKPESVEGRLRLKVKRTRYAPKKLAALNYFSRCKFRSLNLKKGGRNSEER